LQTTVQVGAEFLVRRGRCGREGSHDELAAGREVRESLAAQLAEPAYDAVALHRASDRAADHEPDPSGSSREGTSDT
jgi:uncharacterized membrane protein